MNLGVALGALGGHDLLYRVSGTGANMLITFQGSMKMQVVTLQAKEWLILAQQVVGYRAVGFMTEAAFFHHWRVFKDKWSFFVCVTFEAKVIFHAHRYAT